MNQTDCPLGFTQTVFQRTFKFDDDPSFKAAWEKLNQRETFVRGQIFPYKVEFATGLKKGPFHTGELNIHHGPGLSVHGVIGDVTETYRDLQYFYGSYVFSFRLVRPTRLEFTAIGENTIEVKLTCFVKTWFSTLWKLGNNFFWSFFKSTIGK